MYLLSENPIDYQPGGDGEEDCRDGDGAEARHRASRCYITDKAPICDPSPWNFMEYHSAWKAYRDDIACGRPACDTLRHWTRVIGVVEWGKILYIPVGKKRPTHTEKYTIHLNGEVMAEHVARAKRRGERAVWPFVVDYADADQGVCDE